MLLQETLAALSLGKLCDEHGLRITGKAVRIHISSRMTKELIAICASTICGSWNVSKFFLNCALHRLVIQHRKTERSYGETRETKQNKNCESKEVQRVLSHELPDWLQEFRENLVDESASEKLRRDSMQRSADTSCSSHHSPMEPRAHVEPGSGEHNVFAHFPRRIRIVKYAEESCPERKISEIWSLQVTKFNKIFSRDPEEPNEVPGADEEAKSHLH